MVAPDQTRVDSFIEFVRGVEPRLVRVLVARYGPDVGRDAAAEALAWGWEHWERVSSMENAAGYLYRVAVSTTRRRHHRRRVLFPEVERARLPWVEPGLPAALRRLTPNQRTAAFLVHSLGWTHAEVAEVMGIAPGTVRKHLGRGMAKLRKSLKVDNDD